MGYALELDAATAAYRADLLAIANAGLVVLVLGFSLLVMLSATRTVRAL